MNLAQAYANYRDLSSKASNSLRQLAFAGIAIVWIFRRGEGAEIRLHPLLTLALVLLSLGLLLDLAQFLTLTLRWWRFGHASERRLHKEYHGDRRRMNEEAFAAPADINKPAEVLFVAKCSAVLSGYGVLVFFLVQNWVGDPPVEGEGSLRVGSGISVAGTAATAPLAPLGRE